MQFWNNMERVVMIDLSHNFSMSLINVKSPKNFQYLVVKVILENLASDSLKSFMAPFYGWGSTVSRLEPLQGGSLFFTIKFPEILGTHFILL